jgi:hypothetical protein
MNKIGDGVTLPKISTNEIEMPICAGKRFEGCLSPMRHASEGWHPICFFSARFSKMGVMPAKAGIPFVSFFSKKTRKWDASLRWHDGLWFVPQYLDSLGFWCHA